MIFGIGNDTIKIASLGESHCPVCARTRPFTLYLNYEYLHALYIFAAVNDKEYVEVCDVCSRGEPIDEHSVVAKHGPPPIPFMRRFGCAIYVVSVAILIAVGLMTGVLSPD